MGFALCFSTRLAVVLVALFASPIAFASGPFDPIVLNYAGLGTSPLGLELKVMSSNWSETYSALRVRDFLAKFRYGYPAGTDLRKIFEDAGLECAAPPAASCTYAGVYTTELRRSTGKVSRTARLLEVSITFEQEPWKVEASAKYIYGSPYSLKSGN